MPRKGRSVKALPEPEKNSQEKRKSSIRWTKNETQLIVQWFCTRNENGVRVNHKAWTTGNYSYAAEMMLNETGLVMKAGVTKKKATDKMIYMIKQYKDLRNTIEQSGWGTGLHGVDGISHEDLEVPTGSCKTAKELILQRCAWYYEYEELFCDHPGLNPPTLIESEQPTRRNSRIINDLELGEELKEGESWLQDSGGSSDYDQDAEEDAIQDDEDESDSSTASFHSALSQMVQDDASAVKKQTKNVTVISDNEESLSSSDTEIPQSKRQKTTPKPRPISRKTPIIEVQSEKATVSRHTKNKRTDRMRSNSPDSSERENSSKPARKKRCNKTRHSMAEATVLEAGFLDQCERDAAGLKDGRRRGMTRQRGRDLAKKGPKNTATLISSRKTAARSASLD